MENRHLNDLWEFNIKSKKFKEIKVNSNNPPKSCKHKSVIYKHYIILFGGTTYENQSWICHGEIYLFNIKKNEWNIIECSNKPESRFDHGMCVIDDRLVISGGVNSTDVSMNDMYYIDINDVINNKSPTWIEIDDIFDGFNMGNVHTHLMVSSNYIIYMFGGSGIYNNFSANNNLIKYVNYNMSFGSMKLDFVRRYIISRILINKKDINIPELVIHSISNHLCFNNKMTTYSINDISKRMHHNGCIIYINNICYMFIFGGYNGFRQINDSYLIKISS